MKMGELKQRIKDLMESAKDTALSNKDDFSAGRYDGIKEVFELISKLDSI